MEIGAQDHLTDPGALAKKIESLASGYGKENNLSEGEEEQLLDASSNTPVGKASHPSTSGEFIPKGEGFSGNKRSVTVGSSQPLPAVPTKENLRKSGHDPKPVVSTTCSVVESLFEEQVDPGLVSQEKGRSSDEVSGPEGGAEVNSRYATTGELDAVCDELSGYISCEIIGVIDQLKDDLAAEVAEVRSIKDQLASLHIEICAIQVSVDRLAAPATKTLITTESESGSSTHESHTKPPVLTSSTDAPSSCTMKIKKFLEDNPAKPKAGFLKNAKLRRLAAEIGMECNLALVTSDTWNVEGIAASFS